MKKTLLAVAIPALLASGVANSATLYNANGTKVDIKGNMRIALTYSDQRKADGEDNTRLQDMGSRFGFAVRHDVGDGLYGLGEYEFGNNTQLRENDFRLRNRLAYVGLGMEGVGELTFGRVWSPFDSVTGADVTYDYGGVMEFGHGDHRIGGDDFLGRVSNTIKFMSASFDGLRLGAAYTTQGDGAADYIKNAYTVTAYYDTGFDVQVNVGYAHDRANTTSIAALDGARSDVWAASVQYNIDALFLAVDVGQIKAKHDLAGGGSFDSTTTISGIGARYKLGKSNVYGNFMFADGDKNAKLKDKYKTVVGTDYQFTPAVRTYVEYAFIEQKDQADAKFRENKASVGMRIYF